MLRNEMWDDVIKFIGRYNGRKDVYIGMREKTEEELFPQSTITEKQKFGRKILDDISEKFNVPRSDINLGVRADVFEILTAGYPLAIHYTYRYHSGCPRYEYLRSPK